MLLRKIFLTISTILFIVTSFLLFLFNNDLEISANSLDYSTYVASSAPEELEISKTIERDPVLVGPGFEKIVLIEPTVFSENSAYVHPPGLEPGFYQIFSGFSEGFFQVGYTTLPVSQPVALNPWFAPVFIVFVVAGILVLVSLFSLKIPARKSFTKISFIVGFTIFFISIMVISLVRIHSLTVFENKTSFNNPASAGAAQNTTQDEERQYSLKFLENLLDSCKNPAEERHSFDSDSTACAASVVGKAVELYGTEGLTTILSSKQAMDFDELCEISSRYAAHLTPLEPIDYNFIEEALICNYSWLNHLVSGSYSDFDSIEKFFEYGHSTCASLKEFADIPEVTLRQQCLRGVGIGLYNLTKNPVYASEYCLQLPELFDPGNCTEGVFLEARLDVLRQNLHKNTSGGVGDRVCSEVSPDFYGFCVKVLSPEFLQDYTVTEFKEKCLQKGSEFTETCSVGVGQLAFWSIAFDDLETLAQICDDRLTASCFERFFLSYSIVQGISKQQLYDTCLVFTSSYYLSDNAKTDTVGNSCAKLEEFIKIVSDGYRVHESDSPNRGTLNRDNQYR